MKYEFTSDELKQVKDLMSRYPEDQPRGALMMVMHVVQDKYGYVPKEMVPVVAEAMGIPEIWVKEVVTFYPLFRWEHEGQRAFGKNHLGICVTLSCEMGGCQKLVSHMKDKYGVEFDGVSEDGKISLQEMQCLGSCHTAPTVLFNDQRHEGLTVEQLDALIEKGRADA